MPPWAVLSIFSWNAEGMRGSSYTVEVKFDSCRIPPTKVSELPHHRFEENKDNEGIFFISPREIGFPNEHKYYSGILTITSYDEKGKVVGTKTKNIGIDVEEMPVEAVKCPDGQTYDVSMKKCVPAKKG